MNGPGLPLPDGWAEVSLREVVTVTGIHVEPRLTPDEDFNYVSLEDIQAGTGRLMDPGPTPGREIASAKTRFQAGDLLYGRLRPYLQKVVIAQSDGVAATELLVLRVHGDVEAEFLQEVFLGPDHQACVSQLMSGARMPRIRAEQLLNLRISLPPRVVQRTIVRSLGVLRHRVSSLRTRVVGGLALAAQFEQRLLTSAFTGELSAVIRTDIEAAAGQALLTGVAAARRAGWDEKHPVDGADPKPVRRAYPEAATPEVDDRSVGLPPSWVWASLEELASAADPVCYGVVEPGDEVEKGVPMVRIQDLAEDGIDRHGMRRVTEAVDQRHVRSRLKGGEVLVSLAGSIGRVARVPTDLAGANINRALAKVTPLDPVLGDWITLALQAPALQDWLAGSARGVARDILNLSTLVRAPIPLAPPRERRWLLGQLRHRMERLKSLRAKLGAADVALDNLWTHLRSRALVGAAVLPDPGDDAVAAARAVKMAIPEEIRKGTRGRAKQVTNNKLKSRDRDVRLDLRGVLEGHAEGLEPLRLLEEAGYGLHDVEAFFKTLAEAVALGTIQERRSESDWPLLVAA